MIRKMVQLSSRAPGVFAGGLLCQLYAVEEVEDGIKAIVITLLFSCLLVIQLFEKGRKTREAGLV